MNVFFHFILPFIPHSWPVAVGIRKPDTERNGRVRDEWFRLVVERRAYHYPILTSHDSKARRDCKVDGYTRVGL